MTSGRVLRPPLWHRLVCLVGLTALAVLLAAGGVDEGGCLMVAGPLAALATLAVAVRSWQLRVQVGPDEVRLVNWLMTVHVPWHDVERFGVDEGGAVWLRRRSGREHPVSAFPSVPRAVFGRGTGPAVARQLESIRQGRRRHGGGRDRPN